MPRPPRNDPGGFCYHVINRGNDRATVFRRPDDYDAFLRVLALACERIELRPLAWCLMPNHFHLVLWPVKAGALSRAMQWVTTCHVRRYHRHYHSCGHVWQGRFKSFVVQGDQHLLTVLRYVERNPVRAGLAAAAEDWQWSSARFAAQLQQKGVRLREAVPDPFLKGPIMGSGYFSSQLQREEGPGLELPRDEDEPGVGGGTSAPLPLQASLEDGPTKRPRDWLAFVNELEDTKELQRLRAAVNRGAPFGEADWQVHTAGKLGLESSLRPRGRPRKRVEK